MVEGWAHRLFNPDFVLDRGNITHRISKNLQKQLDESIDFGVVAIVKIGVRDDHDKGEKEHHDHEDCQKR